jgi:heme exporter protein C
MIQALANPARFMAFSKWAAPIFAVLAAILLASGFALGFAAPEGAQGTGGQGDAVRFLFFHPQLAMMAMAIYAAMAISAFFGFVFRHSLADAATRAIAPIGAVYTFLALATGSLWGVRTWGTWWVWDAKLTAVLVLFLLFLGYIALTESIDDEAKANRAGSILAMVGVVTLPIIHYSVYWWNTLHQGSSVLSSGIAAPYAAPFWLNFFGFGLLFGALWLVRVRAEVWRRRAGALAVQAAGKS